MDQQLCQAEISLNIPLPEVVGELMTLAAGINPFELKHVNIQYSNKKILHDLSWAVA